MDDVQPLPLTDDDFFSDMDGDDSYAGNQVVGTGSRLVISTSINENGRSSRANPFSGTEVRTRNISNRNPNKANGVMNSVNNVSENANEMQIRSSGGRTLHESGSNQDSLPINTPDEDNSTNNQVNQTQQSSSFGIRSHCHVTPKSEEGNTVRNQLIIISVVTTFFAGGELVGSVYSESVANATDTVHLISDVLSFLISLLAVFLAKKNPTSRLPWGYHRAEVLGALLSVFIIWVVTGVLVYLAAMRVKYGTYGQVDPSYMLWTAIVGVIFNIIMAVVLNVEWFNCKVSHGHSHGSHGHSHGGDHSAHGHSHRQMTSSRRRNGEYEQLAASGEEADERDTDVGETEASSSNKKKEKNIVIRAAFVHIIGDLIQSIGVLIAALIIKFKGAEENSVYRLADPICTFIFSVLVLITTTTVITDAFYILMEAAPKQINYSNIYERLMRLGGVKSVHSLKIWSLTPNSVSASVHLAVDPNHPFPFELVSKANEVLREDEVITRSTVQVEVYDDHNAKNCMQCLHPKPPNSSLVV
ncbi:proton-coupled zinc antiporter SLC30A8-like isoform X1 [Watersipora subatra]|uniref:proton-coupled zinc antiporter SLC30A8-like isoform X1 n=1 Tax=Watersipora subatra TaxID=2589382 RepID=UPI00355BB80C